MKNIEMIDIRKVDIVKELCVLAEKNNIIKRIIIFGSAAQKKCSEDSDLDICLEIIGETNDLKLHDFRVKANKACDYNCDIVIYNQVGSNLKEEINNKGVVVYEI